MNASPIAPVASVEFADIPGTSLRVSRVALGTWAIGGWMWGGSDERDSIATIQAALGHGINLIDTAPDYGFGHAEEIVGKAITAAGTRDRVVIATKAGLDWRGDRPFRNASRKRILHEVDESLRRLRTDHIDVYQVHWPDALVPTEETADAMRVLLQQGKIRAIGVSNFSVAQIERFRRVAPLTSSSRRTTSSSATWIQILPYCLENDIATFGYGALCRGLLTGRMDTGTAFGEGDLRHADPKFRPPRFAQYLAAVRQLDHLAQR
jgi:aryl-alcohol dehydrogenase-like predicted oxidoreductase